MQATNDMYVAPVRTIAPLKGFSSSPTFGKLAAALSKAQGVMAGAAKDATNPYFQSKYADLASVIEAIRKPFSENGLAFMQFPVFGEGEVEIETLLAHESGEWVAQTLAVPVSKNKAGGYDAQVVGSAITYGKRYGIQAIAGVPSEDDDGNAAARAAADDAEKNQKAQQSLQQRAVAIATEAAKNGVDAFRAAWKTMSKPMRVAIEGRLDEFQEMAKEADAMKAGSGDAAE